MDPFSVAAIEGTKVVAKETVKETGKAISEGLQEEIKKASNEIGEGIKDTYLTEETVSINEIDETIPSELKEISNEVSEIENQIDFQPETVAEKAGEIKVNIESIVGKINNFIGEFKENLNNKVSYVEHADHVINNGLDIGKDIKTYTDELKGRLKEVGIDVDKILENIHSIESHSNIDDSDFEEDFEEGEE